MELRRIIISEVDDHQVIILKEVDGDRSFPIVIGIFEATSIDRRVKGLSAPRPLTHDLITAVVEQMGGEIQDIVISDLRDHTYYAKLRERGIEVIEPPRDHPWGRHLAVTDPDGYKIEILGSVRKTKRPAGRSSQ